ncbi:MAG TPA: ATP-binding protein, partial [Polyangiaceae bacterium]|nr:ATP-binding protein [Polyangiaceae bacterium]
WALPFVHMGVVLTTPFHHLAYYDARLVPGEAFDALTYSFTPLDQLAYGYMALPALATSGLLFKALVGQTETFRAQLLPVAIALTLPLISAVLLIAGVPVLGQRDSAPYAFAISSVIIAHTLLRRRLFDLNPIAYEAVVAATPDAVLVLDEVERVVDVNPALSRLLGPQGKLIGEPLSAALPWVRPALVCEPWQPIDIELSAERIVEARSGPLTTRSGRVVGRVLTFRDVTLTRQAALALQAQNRELEQRVRDRTQQLRDVLDQAFQLMGMLELDGTLIHVNRAALQMIGGKLEDVIGRKFWETPWWAHSEEGRRTLQGAIEQAAHGQLVRFSTTHHDRTGEVRYIDFSIKPVLDEHGNATVLVPEGRDVTDLRRADEQKRALEQHLVQAQKVESLGRLAGGVAHDFNNLLAAILGNIELARMDLPSDSPVTQNLDDILHASESAKALVQQLLVFARKPSTDAAVAVVDLRAAIEATLRLLGRVLGADVKIASSLPPEAVKVRMEPRQLEQVLVNLAVNARDAMPEGGTLRIMLDQVGEPGARRARLVVADSGSGMTPEVLQRIFEPFFTTKPAGKGTGLGLAVVFAMVQQAGGEVSVKSEIGSGTSFTMLLPVALADVEPSAPKLQLDLPGGQETILLVEDQAELSRFAQLMLRRLGYTVHAFGNAEELLQRLDQLPRAHLLLSDVVLPGISGPALAEKLAHTQPWLRVLFASGYHDESLSRRSSGLAESRVLAKPFSLGELARAVRETLEAPPP